MSAATLSKHHLSPKEYIAQERASATRHEYFNGEIFEMAGSSRSHAQIGVNLMVKLSQALGQSQCRVYGSDLRVHVPATGLYTYPDLSVACPPEFLEPAPLDTLINPVLLVEILSESTEPYDRGKKFENYRSIQTLQAYVLVAQERVHIERYTRQADGDWLLHEVGPGGRLSLSLPCGECDFGVEEIYALVL